MSRTILPPDNTDKGLDDGVFRACWRCNMRGQRVNLQLPKTATTLHDGQPVKPGDLTTYCCPVCGATAQWIFHPRMDGSAEQKHKVGSGAYSVSSMLSDPDSRCFVSSEAPPERWEVCVDYSQEPDFSMYAIGASDGKDGFGMTHGPCPSLEELLETVVGWPGSVLFGFKGDEFCPLYRWHEGRAQWMSL